MNGSLQPGQLVAFFGYASFLTTPLRTAIEYVIMSTRAYVGAGRVLRIMNVAPTVTDPEHPTAWPATFEKLEDRNTGILVQRGQLVALVTNTPDEAALIVDRLGRFVADTNGVFLNDLPIDTFALNDLRTNVVVSEIEPRLFSGELRYELMPHGIADDEQISRFCRQRVRWMCSTRSTTVSQLSSKNAVAVFPAVNASVSVSRAPSSPTRTFCCSSSPPPPLTRTRKAGSPHGCETFATVATTLVATTSPLLLEKMDLVYVVTNGRVTEHGTHDELVSRSARYRQVVLREDT